MPLLTVPLPGGVVHVPAPDQYVVAVALVPLLSADTGRFPVVSVAKFTEVMSITSTDFTLPSFFVAISRPLFLDSIGQSLAFDNSGNTACATFESGGYGLPCASRCSHGSHFHSLLDRETCRC